MAQTRYEECRYWLKKYEERLAHLKANFATQGAIELCEVQCKTYRDELALIEKQLSTAKEWEPDIKAKVEQVKNEILADITSGFVAREVRSFSDLHDYTDANCYGGFCEEGSNWSLVFVAEVQDRVDLWIKSEKFQKALEEIDNIEL